MNLTVYTDGSCPGNPGPGGAAALALKDGRADARWAGLHVPHSTNNEMELYAVWLAAHFIAEPGDSVAIFTDSQLVIGALSKGWKMKAPHLIWLRDRILELCSNKGLTMTYSHVKGHSGVEHNEVVDRLAGQQAALAVAKVKGCQPPVS